MPSPVAHSAAAYFFWRTGQRSLPKPESSAAALLQFSIFLVLSFLPDLDSVPGLIFSDLGRYHNNLSHSFAAGLLAAIAVGVVARGMGGTSFLLWFRFGLLCYWTHLVMDFFTVSRGVMLFWPLTDQRFVSSVKLFTGLHWSQGLWSISHLYTFFSEGIFVLGAFLLAAALRKRRALPPFVLLLAAAFAAGPGCESPDAPPSPPASSAVERQPERAFRVVWCQDREGMKDVYALGSRLFLMGYDSEDGRGEREILPGAANYSRPLLTPGGDRIVFSDRARRKVLIVSWDGSGLTEIADGRALDCWKDPETGLEWVYVGDGSQKHPRLHKEIRRYRLDDYRIQEPVSKRWTVNENNFQLSADGRYASSDVARRGNGLLGLRDSSWESRGKGCWPALAPDNSYRLWRLDRDHRHLLIDKPGTGRTGRIDASGAPGIDGGEIFHPRWSNDPRFMVLSGPYREGRGSNLIKNGGPGVEIFIGRFAADYSSLGSWRRVTDNGYADFYPDLWLSGN